jgi:hypothetical protein
VPSPHIDEVDEMFGGDISAHPQHQEIRCASARDRHATTYAVTERRGDGQIDVDVWPADDPRADVGGVPRALRYLLRSIRCEPVPDMSTWLREEAGHGRPDGGPHIRMRGEWKP